MIAKSTLQAGNSISGNSKASQSRIEIGPRDIKQQQVTLVETGHKAKKSSSKKAKRLPKSRGLLEEIQHNLYAKARINMENKPRAVKTYDEFKQVLCDKGGFIKAAWCGSGRMRSKNQRGNRRHHQGHALRKRRAACIYMHTMRATSQANRVLRQKLLNTNALLAVKLPGNIRQP